VEIAAISVVVDLRGDSSWRTAEFAQDIEEILREF
jgi:hypothetical protein